MTSYGVIDVLFLGFLAICHGDYPIAEPSIESGYSSKVPLDFGPFEEALASVDSRMEQLNRLLLPEDVKVADIQGFLTDGKLTSEELVTFYIHRIKAYDEGVFNSVAQLNPKALDDARASDAARGAKGGNTTSLLQLSRPLEGIPVLIKWNVAIAKLSTTAGAVAMTDWIPSRDAHLVNQLRNSAGAIILGHAQLSEWANYLDPSMPNGFSALGGQARPAYGMYDPFGSSTGSAVAVSANFVPLAVGTETTGSIIMPSKVNSVVGLRPSTGLVSDDYVIPLCSALDTAGPIAKSVTDLSIALTAMTGVDPDAPSSPADGLKGTDFAKHATANTTDELLVGIPSFPKNASSDPRLQYPPGTQLDESTIEILGSMFEEENEKYAEIGKILRDNGVEVTTFDPMDLRQTRFNLGPLLEYCMKDSFDAFTSRLAPAEATFPRATLEEVVSFNKEDPSNYIPYGQDFLEASVGTTITHEEFEQHKNETIEGARALLDSVFAKSGANVILVNGLSKAYSIAGYPALVVPSGYLDLPEGEGVEPDGIVFNAPHLGEAKLIQVGYIYEQATKVRVNPDIEATLNEVTLKAASSAECVYLHPLAIIFVLASTIVKKAL